MAICPSGHFHTRCGVYVYLRLGCPELLPDKQIAPHFLFVLQLTWSGRQTSHQMNLNNLLESAQDRIYESPVMDVFYLQIEDTLAKSNTETIGEDDDEYDWGD